MKKISAVLLVLFMLTLIVPAIAAESKIPFSESWSISVSSDVGNTIGKAFDENPATYWHTSYTVLDGKITQHDECPHTITVDFGTVQKVSGIRYTSRIDSNSGIVRSFNIYSSDDGTTFKKIYVGTFDFGNGIEYRTDSVRSASWGDVPMRAMQIEITDAISGYGTAAEIEFLSGTAGTAISGGEIKTEEKTGIKSEEKNEEKTEKKNENLVDRSDWTVTASSDIGNTAGRMIDGDKDTVWHTQYTAEGSNILSHDEPPFTIEYTLPEPTEISGVAILPRLVGNTGMILNAELYAADSDSGEYYVLKPLLELDKTFTQKDIPFTANVRVKKIKLVVTASISNFGTMAEFYAFAANDKLETVELSEFDAYESESILYKIDSDNFTSSYDGENWLSNVPANMFDSSTGTFWQTARLPGIISFDIDLGGIHSISQMRYYPRQSADMDGMWLKINIYAGTDINNLIQIKENLVLKQDLSEKIIDFGEEISARYIGIEIIEDVFERASCSELSFYQTKQAKDSELSDSEKYELKIGSKTIKRIYISQESTSEIDVAPYIVNGSTLIPLRGLLEKMGAEIEWDGTKQIITVNDGKNVITLQIFNRLVYVKNNVNGVQTRYTLLNYPVIKDSRTFIPIRFVSEQLGYKVEWDGQTQTVTISK